MLIARDNNVSMLTIGQTGVHIIFQPSPKWTNRATLHVNTPGFEYVVYLDNLIKKHSKLKFRKKKTSTGHDVTEFIYSCLKSALYLVLGLFTLWSLGMQEVFKLQQNTDFESSLCTVLIKT